MNEINCVSKDICEAKMNMHDERFRRDKERLDKFEESIAKLNEASALLTQMLAIHSEDIKDHASRITTLEHRPGSLWDKLIGGIIGAVSGGLVATVMALILK